MMRAKSMRAAGAALALACAAAWLAGCAATQTQAPASHPAPTHATAPAPAPTATGTPVGTTASGGTISVNPPTGAPAVVDSTPSADAIAVLGTIPEPLGRPTDIEPVPVPSPTEALGSGKAGATVPDSPASGTSSAPSSSPAPAGGAASAGAASAGTSSSRDSCWRVQVLAPPEQDRADRMAEAAQSQLGVPFVVEKEGGLYKVRTRDCLTSSRATALKNQAVADGFEGAFRFLKPSGPKR